MSWFEAGALYTVARCPDEYQQTHARAVASWLAAIDDSRFHDHAGNALSRGGTQCGFGRELPNSAG